MYPRKPLDEDIGWADPDRDLPSRGGLGKMPPVLAGHGTPEVREAVGRFYASVHAMFEAWIARRQSPNTRRAYRRDVLDFVEFLGIPIATTQTAGKPVKTIHPDHGWQLLKATVPQVQTWRDFLHEERNAAPNTLNRRVSSVSGFFRFMREAAAEARLPITVPNPAHSQFISRETQQPVTPTEALTATRARQLMSLPEGESVLAYRDRALLKLYLYTGARIGTGCRLKVEDFIDDDEDPKVHIQEKGRGKSKRPLGINAIAADAIREYIARAELTSGPLFRPRLNPRSEKLATRAMEGSTMYRLLQSYLERVPQAMKEHELQDGSKQIRCLYSPHSIRATTATLLLDAGEDIREVQKLLGHKHITVTQVYDKRRRGTKDSASHRLAV
jgi:site-specific recombinase XerD